MKFLKKIFIIILLIMFLIPVVKVNANGGEVPIKKADGDGYVTYIGTNVQVKIPTNYELPDTAFRAVWVSAFTGDINGFSSETQYKQEMIDLLDTLEYYNINAMLFHVRARNDAFYESKYNKWSTYYNTNPTWDALPWIIEEAHKRGIEFHAWLNPYRVSTAASNLSELAKTFKGSNPASNPNNLLGATKCVILNPGLPNVRTFLINTCMELIENYNIDAIHFDDYFYAAGIDDSETRAIYNTKGLSVDDWRREQIDLFIKGLSDSMRLYNIKSGRRVQLGISPSGIWRSAGGDSYVKYDSNGNAITNGSSTTSSFEHYGGYLFADTLKWINEEWIDYILPQTYWAIEHGTGGYPDLVDWWAKVVKHKKVNLYIALGLYMRSESGGSSWATSELEGYNQILYASKYDTVKGHSVYDYKSLRASAAGSDRSFKGVNELWSKPAILPEIRTMDKIIIDNPKNLSIGKVNNGFRLQFEKIENAKFYIIYRSENEITYGANEVIDIIGDLSTDGIINYVDLVDNNKDYYYGVRAQSNSLTLTEGVSKSSNSSKVVNEAPIEKVEKIITSSNTITNSNLEIKWQKVFNPIGDDVKYKLLYSYDNNSWNEKEEISDVTSGYIQTSLFIPTNTKKLYLKVATYNNVGRSESDIKELNIDEGFGKINHFSVFGNLYSGKNIKFVWNNFTDIKGIKYIIQKSFDGFEFIDMLEVEANGATNTVTTFKLPEEVGKVYYKIKGIWENKVAYSDILELNITKELGEFTNLLIDNKEPSNTYIINEGEYLNISFDTKSSSINYISRLSRDKSSWIIASKFDSKNKVQTENNKIKQTIYASGSEYKLYYLLEANHESGSLVNDIIEIYVVPEIIFYDELATFMIREQKLSTNEINIFN